MAEDPLTLKQKVRMMLRATLKCLMGDSLQECMWMLRIVAVRHGFLGVIWSWEHALLLNYYTSGQLELRQNNGLTSWHKVIVSKLTYMSQELGQQGKERICIA